MLIFNQYLQKYWPIWSCSYKTCCFYYFMKAESILFTNNFTFSLIMGGKVAFFCSKNKIPTFGELEEIWKCGRHLGEPDLRHTHSIQTHTHKTVTTNKPLAIFKRLWEREITLEEPDTAYSSCKRFTCNVEVWWRHRLQHQGVPLRDIAFCCILSHYYQKLQCILMGFYVMWQKMWSVIKIMLVFLAF